MATGRLVIIDDEPDVGAFIKTVAERCGYEVFLTQDAATFKETCTTIRPDTIMLDLAMPETDGVELLRYLADTGCDARLLIISGFERRVLETALRLGEAQGLKMAGTVSKPVAVRELQTLLAGLHSEP